jgi:hypothetical protein
MWEIEHEIFNTIFALKIFGFDEVMVPIINKYLEMFGVVIQMFGYFDRSYCSIAFNGD